jgi:hypothetical protein
MQEIILASRMGVSRLMDVLVRLLGQSYKVVLAIRKLDWFARLDHFI